MSRRITHITAHRADGTNSRIDLDDCWLCGIAEVWCGARCVDPLASRDLAIVLDTIWENQQ